MDGGAKASSPGRIMENDIDEETMSVDNDIEDAARGDYSDLVFPSHSESERAEEQRLFGIVLFSNYLNISKKLHI